MAETDNTLHFEFPQKDGGRTVRMPETPKLDKPIVHFQLPHDENGNPTDVDYDLANLFLAWAKQELGDKAYITMSSYDISASGAEVENVKLDAISLKEFLKKHEIKDGAGE